MKQISRYVAGRAATGLLTLFLVSVLVFLAIHFVPGGYEQAVMSPMASDQARQNLIDKYSLDAPLPLQFWDWFRHALVGDFGQSLGDETPVRSLMANWIPVTAELAALATLFVMFIGLPLALLAGMARSRLARGLSRLGGALAMSTPDFVLGSLLVYLFSTYALGLSVGGYVPFADDPGANLKSMALPVFTLGIFGLAVVIRTGRDAVAAVLSSPHITAATARGESTSHIVRHHILRNAGIPLVTVLTTYMGYLLGGAVVVESLFSLPGLGQAVLTNVGQRNYPVVQGVVLVSAAAFIFLNLVADFLYGIIDPRVAKDRTS
ncbi:ABC transporter permease subunit [Streptomyces sp. SID8361]|uniref:ABC transporter permease n=1 Tax=Streptomyces sp. MnatMP-M27 TaxID=1839768 RepID=UPI00081EC1FC|nr:ABC transporter permease [Streptomyces sp. MnatMP-M27]MYU10065.1 ABC transporter permease subunit [Streptomyces sp. SID8361]SCF67995.1 peptide/nickel transport system permease protein [Streptomyces sp. MnatMP-M27]